MNAIEQQITDNLKVAMKAGESETVSVLRMLRADLRNAAIDAKGELSEEAVTKVLTKALKQRKDAAMSFEDADRTDQAAAERAEAAIIEEYLPEGLAEDELRSIVDRVAAESGAEGMVDIGKIMGPVMKEVAGRADGSFVKQLVEERLGN